LISEALVIGLRLVHNPTELLSIAQPAPPDSDSSTVLVFPRAWLYLPSSSGTVFFFGLSPCTKSNRHSSSSSRQGHMASSTLTATISPGLGIVLFLVSCFQRVCNSAIQILVSSRDQTTINSPFFPEFLGASDLVSIDSEGLVSAQEETMRII
jgi:hypothetical protein